MKKLLSTDVIELSEADVYYESASFKEKLGDKIESAKEYISSSPLVKKIGNFLGCVLILLIILTFVVLGNKSISKKVVPVVKSFFVSESVGLEIESDPSGTQATLSLLQAQTGEKVKLPSNRKMWTKPELLYLAGKISKEECTRTGYCFQPVLIQAIMDRESDNYDPFSLNLEESRIKAKVKDIPGEGALSKGLAPFSFGVMQINWGWHKHTCKDLLESEGGDPEALYNKLFDPVVNIKCAYAVLIEKWQVAKGTGVERLYNAVGCYNGQVKGSCNRAYASDVINVRLPKIIEQQVKQLS